MFEYADNLLEKWYPTLEEGDKKGVVVLITTAKEGAVAGGPAFNAAVGETVLESIATESLPSECLHFALSLFFIRFPHVSIISAMTFLLGYLTRVAFEHLCSWRFEHRSAGNILPG